MRLNRRTLLALLGVPTVGPLAGPTASPVEAALPEGTGERRQLSHPLVAPTHVVVIATTRTVVAGRLSDIPEDELPGHIEVYLRDQLMYSQFVGFGFQRGLDGLEALLVLHETTAQTMLRLGPGDSADQISVRHTGTLAKMLRPSYVVVETGK